MQASEQTKRGRVPPMDSPEESRTQTVGRKRKLAPSSYSNGTQHPQTKFAENSDSDDGSIESGEIYPHAASERRASSASVGDRPDIRTASDKQDKLWKTFCLDPHQVVKIPREKLIVSCYRCGSNSHWGDDCPDLPEWIAKRGPTIWSAKHAAQFVEDQSKQQRGHGKR